MRTLGHLCEILALGEARLSPDQCPWGYCHLLCSTCLISVILEFAVYLLLDPHSRKGDYYRLGEHYKVGVFSVVRGGLDKNRLQWNASVFQNTRDGTLQELSPCCVMGIHTNLVSKALRT